jgi:hypothetical protein
MSCFEVQVLEPTIHTIEIETCVNGQVTSLDVVQYDIASLEVTHCVALLPSNFDTIVSGIIPVWNILGGTGIYVSSQNGIYTVNTSGLQPSGNYSLIGHNHVSSDIVNFNNSVSGLLPVTNILSGSGISIISNSGNFTVAVTGQFGLTGEEVDDRVSNLLTAGSNILINYNDSGNSLTISTSGLQPSGNYSLIGHNHNSSDILDFITTVSGLLPNTYYAAVPWTSNHTLVDGTRYLVNDLVYENGRLYRANYDNESVPVGDTLYWTDIGPGYRLNIDGRDISNIPYPVTSVNGHTQDVELSTSDLADFTNAVNKLIPPSTFSSLTGTSGIAVSTSGTHYFIGLLNPSIELSYITDLPNQARSFLLDSSSNNLQTLVNDETGSGLLVFNTSPAFSGIPTVPTAASGTSNTQIANTAFVRTEISNLVNSAPAALDTLNELSTALGNDPNFATTVTNNLAGKANLSGAIFTGSISGPSGNFTSLKANNIDVSVSGHAHTSSNITDFNSSVSGLLPSIGGSGYITTSFANNIYTVGVTGLQPSGNYSVVGHTHTSSQISNFNSSVSGLLPIISGSGYINSLFSNNQYIISTSGLQPSGNYANAVHTHTSSDITNFNSAVSGLLPIKDILAGSGISVSSSSGVYTIGANVSGVILEAIQDNFGSGFFVAGTGVKLTYNDTANTLRLDNLHTEINELSLEPQGFVNRLDSIISFNDSTRTFTIAPTGTSYDIYIEGVKITKTTSESIVIPTGTALNYLHFNTDTGLLDNKTTEFNFDTDVPIAYIHWNSSINQSTFFGEERHGIRMDSSTHKWIHNTFGMQYINGLSIEGYTLLGNGSSNSHAQIDISDGTLYQEDIIINITDGDNGVEFTQQLSPIAYIPVYYHLGSTGQWVRDVSTPYPLKYNATRAQYNLLSGGTWTIPNVPNNRYFAMWIVATNDINDPILAIMGQREDSSLGSAENNNNWSDINLTNIPTNELRPLYRLIFVTNATFTNTPKSSLQSILDLRKSILTSTYGVTQNDHGNLFGLGDDDHFQYVHINEPRTITANHTFSNGLISNGPITVSGVNVSVNGHSHISSDITDFNTSVSGLLPVTNIIGGTNISVIPSGTSYTVSVSGQLGLTAEEVDDRVSSLLIGGSGISLNYNDNDNILTVSATGFQPVGSYSIVGHTHNASDITSGTLSDSRLSDKVLSAVNIYLWSSFR